MARNHKLYRRGPHYFNAVQVCQDLHEALFSGFETDQEHIDTMYDYLVVKLDLWDSSEESAYDKIVKQLITQSIQDYKSKFPGTTV